MIAANYDMITVGGGLGGASLAKALAEQGHRVLVLERETRFKDRVRGEQMSSWGAAEASELGIYDILTGSCAHEMPFWDIYVGPAQLMHRDLTATTPSGLPNLTFYHPEMQEVLLAAAESAGANVRRGVRVTGFETGRPPIVTIDKDGYGEKLSARLLVAADGRNSPVRRWAGFPVIRDPDRLHIAGLLLDEVRLPDDAAYMVFSPMTGQVAPIFPQGNGRVRAYIAARKSDNIRLQGEKDIPRFLAENARIGVPGEVFERARPHGPLATFDGADNWVEHPYKDGVALIGDAAATTDPSWGQGLSLTVRDVRVLRDELMADDDWERAAHKYAERHDRYYEVLHTVEDWFTELFYAKGPGADARRGRALPLIGQDPTRVPDALQNGPEAVTVDEATKRRFFGEGV